jgi:pimeloyl-ACP methyl ester carboxylesterase
MRTLARWVSRAVLTIVALGIILVVGFRLAAAWRESEPTPGAPSTGQYVPTADGRMFAQVRGSGTPVILVHGTAAWSGFWSDTADQLAQAGFQAIAIDLPPFGFSDHSPAAAYTRSDQARRILDLVRALQLKDPLIVGHSFGAGPAADAVMREPSAFKGLVLVCAALGLPTEGDEPPPDDAIVRAILGQPLVAEALVASTVTNPLLTRTLLRSFLYRKDAATGHQADILRQPLNRSGTTRSYARWLPSLLFVDRAAISARPSNYSQLRTPTALIWGREDTVTPLPQGNRLHSLIVGSTLDVIDGTGHIPHIEAPAEFTKLLIARLNELRGR